MTSQQNQELLMLKAVIATSNANNSIWTANTHYSAALTKIVNAVGLIESLIGAQGETTKGETMAKNEMRTTLEGQIMHISDTLVAHGKITGSHPLSEKAYASATKLRRMKDEEFIGHAVRIIEMAEDITPATLTALGLTQTQIENASLNRAAFSSLVGTNTQVRSAVSEVTRQLEEELDKAMDVVRNELDPIAKLYQYSEPNFYGEYTNSRQIVDPSFNTRSLTVNITCNGKPVEGAEAVITPGDIPKVSGKTGVFVINQLGAATYTMLISNKDHQSKTVQFTVDNNQHTIVDVELLPKDMTNPN